MHNSLRFRLTIIFIGLATIPLLIVSLLLAQRNFATLTEQAIILQSEIAQRVGKDVTNFINNRENELTLLATTRNILSLEEEDQIKIILALLTKDNIYEEIALLNSEGQEIIRVQNLHVFTEEELNNRANLPEFEQVKKTQTVYYSPVQFNKATGEPFMIIAVPSFDVRSGTFNGVLTANFRFRSIWDLMSSTRLPGSGIVYLVDAEKRIVAHRDPFIVLQGTEIHLPADDGFHPGLENENAAIAFVSDTFGVQTFYTVAELKSNEALSLAISNFLLTIAAIILALAVAIVMSIFAARQIVAPIERMVVTTNAIATGDLSQELPVTQNDEIGALAIAFNLMTVQLRDLIGGLEEEIQERRLAEKSLQRFYDILESTNDFVGVSDKDGRSLYVNKAGRQMIGIGTDEDISPLFIKDYHPPIVIETILMPGLSIAAKEGVWSGETTFLARNGHEIATLQVLISHKSANGEIEYFSTIARDITGRKKTEQQIKSYMAELERSNNELEQFAYVSSHDLQEPLRKILVFGTRLGEKYSDALDERGLDYLSRMQNAAERMQVLIEDLLSFSRISTTQVESYTAVDLNKIVAEIISDLEPRLQGEDGRIIVPILPVIEANRTQMHQLFLNLLTNGLKFRREGIPAEVRLECEILPATAISLSQCQITVIDNGIGFEQKYDERIFIMFQRLHNRSQHEGTGVGLAVCRKIVERHNGTITASSPSEIGATFTVTLPMTQTRPRRVNPPKQ